MVGSTQPYDDPTFLREVWGFFALGIVVFVARFTVRLRKAGFRRFQGDDYVAILVLGCYIIDTVTVTIIYIKGSNVDFTEAELNAFDDEQIAEIVYGSKMMVLALYSYITTIWGLKACLLFFYNRLTFGLTQRLLVKAMAFVCVATYTSMFLYVALSCRPFSQNYQVRPLPHASCTLRKQNFVVCTVLNTVTDGLILSIPVPLLFKLRIPLKKKIPIGILLCSGVFVISAAIIRIEMTLKKVPSTLTINRWGILETNIALIAVNAPIIRPLFSLHFWTGQRSRQSSARSHRTPPSASSAFSKFSSILKRTDTALEMGDVSGKSTTLNTDGDNQTRLSEEAIERLSNQDGIVARPARVLERMSAGDLERLAHPGEHVESMFECRFDSFGGEQEEVGEVREPERVVRRSWRFRGRR